MTARATRKPPGRGYPGAIAATTLFKTAVAVSATGMAGAVATEPDSAWYRALDKPRWQPPPAVFPLVWTPLYGLLAFAGARVLDRTTGPERAAFRRAYTVNLALNAGWTAVFFRGHSPRAALAEIVALDVSNLDLLRRAWRADRIAAAAIGPYVAWTAFATALTASITARNPYGRARLAAQGAEKAGGRVRHEPVTGPG